MLAAVRGPGAMADSVKGIRAATTQPLAIRGGVLMLPLDAQRHGDNWPQTIEFKLDSGEAIVGCVVWIEPATERGEAHWTAPLQPLRVRGMLRDDDSAHADPGLGPFVLAELPAGGDGELRLERQKLRPVWLDRLPATSLLGSPPLMRHAMEWREAPDLPDLSSPLEYWRWVLLAERIGARPPSPEHFGEPGSLAARHVADLWQFAIARLAQIEPDLARQCLDLLTRIGRDGQQRIAMWPTDERDLNALLGVLLNRAADDEAIRTAAAAWLQMRDPIVAWPESELHTSARLAIINRSNDIVPVRMSWSGEGGDPDGSLLEPLVLTRVEIERPIISSLLHLRDVRPVEPARQILSLASGSWRQQFAFGQRVLEAQPPGAFLPLLSAPLTLAEIQAQQRRVVPAERATSVSVRRLARRWEVFIDCRRPDTQGPDHAPAGEGASAAAPRTQHAAPDHAATTHAQTFDRMRGTEAVAIVLGSRDMRGDDEIIIIVPESGFHEVIGSAEREMQIHRRSYADRWYTRIVLPAGWVQRDDDAPLLLGCVRSHGDGADLELGPGSALPWRLDPGRAVIDLAHWDDMPSPPQD